VKKGSLTPSELDSSILKPKNLSGSGSTRFYRPAQLRFLLTIAASKPRSKSVAGSAASLEYDDGFSFKKFIEHD